MSVAGVYVVFGTGTVYVGESGDILARTLVRYAHLLGWPWSIVRYLGAAPKRARLRAEEAVAVAYAAAGLRVVSLTATETAHRAGAAIKALARASDQFRRSASEGQRVRWAKKTPEERAVHMRRLQRGRTHESLSAAGRKGALRRWHPEQLVALEPHCNHAGGCYKPSFPF